MLTPIPFATNLGGRNYDYTKRYGPDKRRDEATENARVWNVYLDEAENYDADIIQGFQNIIDGLLIFASLFSAVVTTFVAQTSQVLRPDSTQIMISLLSENNQLLRAAGDITSIGAVPVVSPDVQGLTNTSLDVWVNGLFFISLVLALSTALLTVLAKQWIQAYTAIVPGGGKTRALIRHFRFRGIVKWKLGDVVESLPLILHTSVAIFFVGLALYVSQLSLPICLFVTVITALTFIFYFVTSILPGFDVACPYRIPFMFSLAKPLVFFLCMTRSILLYFWYELAGTQTSIRWPKLSRTSLKMAEHKEVFPDQNNNLSWVTSSLTCATLDWIFTHSSNHSVKTIVVEAICALLEESNSDENSRDEFYRMVSSPEHHNFFTSTVEYALSELLGVPPPTSTKTQDDLEQNTCSRLVRNIITISCSKSLLEGPLTSLEGWQVKIRGTLITAYHTAIKRGHHALSEHILDWGNPKIISEPRCASRVLLLCAAHGDEEDLYCLFDRGMDPVNYRDKSGWTALHYAARYDNLGGVIAIVQREPALMSVRARRPQGYTALDLAIQFGNSDVVAYLVDHGAEPPISPLHAAVRSPRRNLSTDMIEIFLDRGWDRLAKDADGWTPIDIAYNENRDAIAEHLKLYQTVRLPDNHVSH